MEIGGCGALPTAAADSSLSMKPLFAGRGCEHLRVTVAAVGPLLPVVGDRFLAASAHRGRRYPAGAHAVAVCASLRLHCAARSGVAPPNSLRSLRSLRSNSRGESDHEARWRAPTPALRCSSPQKSPLPGTARREAHQRWCSGEAPTASVKRSSLFGCAFAAHPTAETCSQSRPAATGRKRTDNRGRRVSAPTALRTGHQRP